MVTINAAELFTFPRSYVAGIATFGLNVSGRFEGLSFIITYEEIGLAVSLQVNANIYPASSRMYFLKDFFTGGEAFQISTGQPADFNVNVGVGFPPGQRNACLFINRPDTIEAFSVVPLPALPPGYWKP